MNINEVSSQFNLSKDTLRYWEKCGLIPPVRRDTNGYREYSEYDQNWIFYIKALRQAGVSVKRLQEFVAKYQQKQPPKERKKLLVSQIKELKKQAMNLQKAIDYLDFKVTHFDDQLLTYENEKLAYEGKAKKDLQN